MICTFGLVVYTNIQLVWFKGRRGNIPRLAYKIHNIFTDGGTVFPMNAIFRKPWFVGFLWIISCSHPTNDEVVLRVNGLCITAEEFAKRTAFVPHRNTSIGTAQVKQDVLAALIAEKILADEAVSVHLDTLETLSAQIHQLEKEAVFEYWVRLKVDNTIEVSRQEIREAYSRSKQKRVVDYWAAPDSFSASRWSALLSRKSTGARALPDNYVPVARQKTIAWGDAWDPVEDAVYQLKQDGVSLPVPVDGVFYVFRLKQIEQSIPTESDFQTQQSVIRDRVWQRKRTSIYEKRIQELMRNVQFKIERERYDRTISVLIRRTAFSGEKAATQLAQLPAPLVLSDIRMDLNAHLQEPFIQFKNNRAWTVEDFLKKLAYGPYLLHYKTKDQLVKDMPRIIRRMVVLETVSDQGYQSGYDKYSSVQERKRMWRNYLLANALQSLLQDSTNVSAGDVKEYYQNHLSEFAPQPPRKIQEVLVENRDLAVELIRRIQSGESMGKMARAYSSRKETASLGGVSPFLNPDDWGVVSRKAFQLPMHSLYGPLETEDRRYSILKVIEIQPIQPKPFQEVMGGIQRKLNATHLHRTLNTIIEARIPGAAISIRQAALDKIAVSDGQLLVTKSHFPGRLVVPFTLPFHAGETWFQGIVKRCW